MELPTSHANGTFSSTFRLLLTVFVLFSLFSEVLGAVPRRLAPISNVAPRYSIKRASSQILPETCALRFWSKKIQPFCERDTLSSFAPAAPAAVPIPLVDFQVHTPVRVKGEFLASQDGNNPERRDEVVQHLPMTPELNPRQKTECTQLLMNHSFAISFGMPFVGNYTPPSCSWTHVLFNLSMVSSGVQFDRLALLFLGDTEVFRTSTAEPNPTGIFFEYIKDMTRYRQLLMQPQKIIFDLGNLISDQFTGDFNATMFATFYTPKDIIPPDPADIILPISAHQAVNNQPSQFTIPDNGPAISNLTFPKNTIRAVASLIATGNANEEFYYGNVPSEFTNTFADNPEEEFFGFSPFREIQIVIDGTVAGVAWPYIVVYTGGIVPSFWRPIVSIGAFDLPEYDIDISPFLPLLLDGAAHEFEIRVMSADNNALNTGLGSNWLVSGRVFVWLDEEQDWVTTGSMTSSSAPDPIIDIEPMLVQNTNGTNVSLAVTTTASRELGFAGVINTSSGAREVSWNQSLAYTSFTNITEDGNLQFLSTKTSGSDASLGFGGRSYNYPFVMDVLFIPLNGSQFNLSASVLQGIHVTGEPFYTQGLTAKENAGSLDATLTSDALWNSNVGGDGTTHVDWEFEAPLMNSEGVESYTRNVTATNSLVVADFQKINGVVL